MRLFDPWMNLGTQAMTDIDGLYEDLTRWRSLIMDGRGQLAAAEMTEMLIQFENTKSPFEKICEQNRRAFAAMKNKQTS